MKKKNSEKKDKKNKELAYGSQVAIISIGTILGILVVIGIALAVYFRDFLF